MTCRFAVLLTLVLSVLGARADVDLDRWPELPDFSYAGYHAGERPIPTVPVVARAADHGAVGDGQADDTAALLAAIAAAGAAGGGAVELGPGTYRLTDVLPLKQDAVVLRGAGSGAGGTVLRFEKGLHELRGQNANFGWSGGLIWAGGRGQGAETLAAVTAAAAAGDTALVVDDAARLAAGQVVELRLHNPADQSLLKMLFAEQIEPFGEPLTNEGRAAATWRVVVKAVEGNRVTLAQPLRLAVDPAWSPKLVSTNCAREIGIEHLRIEFPPLEYLGHHKEYGFNAIYFDAVRDGWVRDVVIHDSDSGIIASRSKNCTFEDIVVSGRAGHYGLQCRVATADCLFQRFDVSAQRFHTVSIQHQVSGNVYTSGRGHNLNCDSHRDAPYANLFDNLTVLVRGKYVNPLASSGTASKYGPAAARNNTYWNLHFVDDGAETAAIRPKRVNEFPAAFMIGWHGDLPVELPADPPSRVVVESVGTPVVPASLYQAQVARRLGW